MADGEASRSLSPGEGFSSLSRKGKWGTGYAESSPQACLGRLRVGDRLVGLA